MILWKRIDTAGLEAARLVRRDDEWRLLGTAVFEHERQPVRLDYEIVCDSQWITRSARVDGWIGAREIASRIEASDGVWRLNGEEIDAVRGCIDVDLNFSPSTNLLPIRRLALEPGSEATVRAAWLRFPSFNLELLEQVYTRIDAHRWRYSSAGGSFVAELDVDDEGFVREYAGVWKAVV